MGSEQPMSSPFGDSQSSVSSPSSDQVRQLSILLVIQATVTAVS